MNQMNSYIIKNPYGKPLTDNCRFILDTVEGLLPKEELSQFYITSTVRDGDKATNVHAMGMAVDLSCQTLRLQRKLYDLMHEKWPGGLGISKVPGNVHVHIDRRDLLPWPSVRFVEMNAKGTWVLCEHSDPVGYAKAYEDVKRICG